MTGALDKYFVVVSGEKLYSSKTTFNLISGERNFDEDGDKLWCSRDAASLLTFNGDSASGFVIAHYCGEVANGITF